MDVQSDLELLRAWVDRRDRDAVGELIRRHINFVHTTAQRHVHDPHLAEDVTQAVFILMLQKAHKIRSEATMASWLFVTTRFAAANATRNLRRREYYEQRAASQARIAGDGDFETVDDAELQPLLNEAIHRLPSTDRAAVVMSFLQQKTHRQVAEALGMSEDAARMRVSRAIRKMRDFFGTRGVEVTGASLGACLARQSVAPAHLAGSTINVAILSQTSAGACGGASALAKGVSNMLLATKLKVAAAVAILVTGAGLVAGQAGREAAGSAPSANVAGDSASATLADGVVVRFLGVAKYPAPADQWYTLDGKAMQRPPGAPARSRETGSPAPTMQTAIRVTAAPDANIQMRVLSAFGVSFDDSRAVGADQVLWQAFGVRPGAQTFDVEVTIADGPWETVATLDAPERVGMTAIGSAKFGGTTFTPMMPGPGGEMIQYISAEVPSLPWRVVYTDIGGAQHEARGKMATSAGRIRTGQFAYDLPINQIARVQLQVHPTSKRILASNISLDPAKPTPVQITTPKVEEK